MKWVVVGCAVIKEALEEAEFVGCVAARQGWHVLYGTFHTTPVILRWEENC